MAGMFQLRTHKRCPRCGVTAPATREYWHGARNNPPWYCQGICRECRGRRKSLAERFWPRVSKTDACWLWTGAHDKHGYGSIGVSSTRTDKTHRVSWALTHGAIPDGLHVLHRCDTPACVNPEHLFLGTHADNMRDMANKSRRAFGSRHHGAKLTEGLVALMKQRMREGVGTLQLAREFNIAPSSVSEIRHGRRWRRVA